MTRFGWMRLLQWLLVILLAWWLLAVLVRWWSGRGPVQQVQASEQQLALGRYLADAADCAACHTASGGAPFAGGVPLHSPFGTIYGTNITPDPDHGIGRYTADDFYHALTRGEARDGHQLYPAMPYVSYKTMTRADSDAIYAYLMNQPAVKQPNPSNDVSFPANIRASLHGWNLLFADAEASPVSKGSSPAWQRGRYLVETLGHCGECHSPRNALGQIDRDRPLEGNSTLGRFAAPEITPWHLASRGWDVASLREYLATGVSARAVASDEMLKVVNLSTSRLDPGDLEAMTIYLFGDTFSPRPFEPENMVPSHLATPRQYLDLCAGCHGRNGEGVPNVAVSLRGNSSVRDPSPHNLIVAILDGLPEHDFPGLARMQDMPGFAPDLDDAEAAALVTWLRKEFGNPLRDGVDAETIRKLRR
jgi:mono/diheme cytochrome c family protein